jgi:hypothetical protein
MEYKKEVFDYNNLKLRNTYARCFDCRDYFPQTNLFDFKVEIVPCIWNVYKILLCQRCARSNFIHLSSIGRCEFIIQRRRFLNATSK